MPACQGVGGRCGGVAIKADLLKEYVTGAVLHALESPRVQEALRTEDQDAPRRVELLAKIKRTREHEGPRQRREREMAVLRQRVESEWRAWLVLRRRRFHEAATSARSRLLD